MTPPPNNWPWVAESLERIETRIERIDKDGCNQRAADLTKIETMNSELKEIKAVLTRIYWGVVTLIGGAAVYFAEQIFFHKR